MEIPIWLFLDIEYTVRYTLCKEAFMDNRSKIIECAIVLFHQKGYDGVGVQEIADVAGITKPTLYHYFGSKYGLLEAVIKERYQGFKEQLTKAMEQPCDLPGKLQAVVSVYFDFASKNRHFYLMIISMMFSGEKSDSYKAVHPLMEEQFIMLSHMFLNAKDALGNMRERQEQYALGFMGFINHYLLYWFSIRFEGRDESGTWGEDVISEHQIYEVVHQFLYGIYV